MSIDKLCAAPQVISRFSAIPVNTLVPFFYRKRESKPKIQIKV
jgi:hypothetical protein